jgi:hypothetical protein
MWQTYIVEAMMQAWIWLGDMVGGCGDWIGVSECCACEFRCASASVVINDLSVAMIGLM